MKVSGSFFEGVDVVKKDDKERSESLGETSGRVGEIYSSIMSEMEKVVAGQKDVIEEIMISVLTRNHALLEGYPGLGKTLIVNTLSQVMDLSFKRIQCTPDLMPSDITGTYLVEEEHGAKKFVFQPGPIFTNILLADEINRTTPKTQSALLEAMQEKQVSAGNCTYQLDRPFFVLATQNPIEMEGTYPLPEAQVDRFLLKITVKYPKAEDEERIIDLYTSKERPQVAKVLSKSQLLDLQDLTRMVPLSEDIKHYALDIVSRTRPDGEGIAKETLDYGASPRATIGLILAGKAKALISGRDYVKKEDVKSVAYPILRHRLILNFESERKGITTDDVIKRILKEA